MPNSKTYPFDPSKASELTAKIAAMGGPQIDSSQTVGQASADHITIGWSIADGQITITILSKPWVVPNSSIWSHIDAALAT